MPIESSPWFVEGTSQWLKNNITKEHIIFEYGSGGSTLFFSDLAKKIISVEHDPEWYTELSHIIETLKKDNIEYKLIRPEKINATTILYKPENYSSQDSKNIGYSFQTYVTSIETFPDVFDFIIIDGRARPSCMMTAPKKIKKNGYVVVDDSERIEYQETALKYLGIPFVEFSETFGQWAKKTSIWKF
jgi:hypothetical protein